MSKLCGTGSKGRIFFCTNHCILVVCVTPHPLFFFVTDPSPPPSLLVSFYTTYCQVASMESALPPTPTCRRSPAQLVITLAITFSLSSTPLPLTPIVRPVRSLGPPAALHRSLKGDHLRCSTTLAVQISGDNNKQSERLSLQIAPSLVHPGKRSNSTAVKVGRCTC